jgi:hypothetical protein
MDKQSTVPSQAAYTKRSTGDTHNQQNLYLTDLNRCDKSNQVFKTQKAGLIKNRPLFPFRLT